MQLARWLSWERYHVLCVVVAAVAHLLPGRLVGGASCAGGFLALQQAGDFSHPAMLAPAVEVRWW